MRKTVLFFLFIVIISSCSKKEVKVQPGDSIRARAAIEQLQKIREYYVSKDAEGLRSMTTSEGFKTVAANMNNFDSAELKLSIRWVDIKDNSTVVLAAWDGQWKQSSQSMTEKGTAMFVFTGTPLKLDAILRDSPFNYP
ncbi:MAG: hypothetical protein HQK99_17140 [Nitrospirae bacterium]|nr:hypothetical protein [Nitrospirota bacterium]